MNKTKTVAGWETGPGDERWVHADDRGRGDAAAESEGERTAFSAGHHPGQFMLGRDPTERFGPGDAALAAGGGGPVETHQKARALRPACLRGVPEGPRRHGPDAPAAPRLLLRPELVDKNGSTWPSANPSTLARHQRPSDREAGSLEALLSNTLTVYAVQCPLTAHGMRLAIRRRGTPRRPSTEW